MIYRTLLVPLTQPGNPIVPFWIVDVASLAERTRAWYLLESYGKVVLDFTTSPTFVAAWGTQVQGLIAAGFDPAQYDRVLYLQDNVAVTGYKGVNWGKESSIQCMGSDYSLFAIIHELGHSFGLSHPTTLDWIGDLAGNVLTLPSLSVTTGGRVGQIYDASTSMGYQATFASFNGPQECDLGWITPMLYAGGDKTIVLTALGVPGGGTYVVKIPCTAWAATSVRIYWLEYRIDTGGQNGVQLHLQGDFACYQPAHYGGGYGAGQTIADGTITIDVLACNPTTATIRLRDTPVVIVPAPSNNATIIAAMQAALTQWRANMVTQTQIDSLKTQVNSLVADGVTPPIVPAGATWSVPPDASGTDAQGHVWTLGAASQYGKLILRDGQQFAGGQGILIDYRNGTLKHKNNAGDWWALSGNGWAATGAP